MDALTAGVVIAANVYSLAWLMTYQRGGARYKKWVSGFAWLLICALGGQVVEIGLNHALATLADAALACVVAVCVHHARGNVSCLLGNRRWCR